MTSKAIFKKAYFYNWDNGILGLEKLLKDPNCDKASAMMIFWHGQPSYYYNSQKELNHEENKIFDFLKEIEQNIISNKYPILISYEIEEQFKPKENGNIPNEMFEAVLGKINYNDVLYPNDNPFEEQILALCTNCNSVNEMYELEKTGANFKLKVNKGYSYPIEIAAGHGQIEALKYFIENNFDINKKYGKNPLLFGAVVRKDFKLVQFLIENGSKVSQKGEFGRTVLHFIAGFGDHGFDEKTLEIITFLIENGADINALDSDKKTPLDLSIMWNNTIYINYITEIEQDKD